MGQWLCGVIQIMVVTAPQSKITCGNVQQIQANRAAFTAILANGSVVAWGHPVWGGDCSDVQDQLRNVQQVQATDYAFARNFG